MFNDIGEKLQGLALFMCVVGIAASVITGLIMIGNNFLTGLIVMIAGSLASWIGSWTTYGLGELIETTSAIHSKLYSMERRESKKATAEKKRCSHCDYLMDAISSSCPNCGRKN